jgi:L-cysteine/cystine lyase
MRANLERLEATDKRAYYICSFLEDKFSIAIISLKDRFIEGLLWVNQLISELTKTEHKKDFHIRFDTMYFNVAGLAPVHTFIEQAQQRWMIQRDESGAVSAETERRIERELKITRKYISLLLGVDKEEIILTDSTTEGISLAIQAIHFRNGDRIITSNAEHDVVRYLVSDMIEKYRIFYGINIDWESKGYPEDEIVEHVTSQTRLVLFSHILFTTGDQLNAKERIIQCRDRYVQESKRNPENKSLGILFLVDGAQSAGQTPLDLKDMGCDFFAMDGHKWLLASEGSGALYARKCYLERRDPHIHFTFMKNYMVVDSEAGFHPKDKYNRPYELATINLPSKIGLRTAVQMIARDGFAKLVGMPEELEEEDVSSISRVLDACFDDRGEVQEINAAIAYPEKGQNAKVTKLQRFFEIKDKCNQLHCRTKDAAETEEFLKECLGQGIRDIRDKIAELKDYFRERLAELEKELQNNKSSKLTVKVVTRERNEGGVVGFQLIDKTTGNPIDVSEEEGKHDYEMHNKLGGMLEKDYGIIFRVIPPPYPPAIRVSLHKYNTCSEIDIMYQALSQTIPLMM